ncbi:murein L,D-transpeptidase catalytic domain family protein [Pedobacter frigidisoli]|uniref:Murein L,D-transpeptidase catalytic domain family protein n=1 Tax=Pedobacter frigidisoli TaxID=2530455 RepID=A0A4R0P1Z0_9SPHI|nr:murein L,D-transpeptidase catalytic domain family protein [Pedobacter frigidisoli]TCD10821.1 murein L,D-transpeptidase catalytic domain family protein [Pedobacter frigidisoli]
MRKYILEISGIAVIAFSLLISAYKNEHSAAENKTSVKVIRIEDAYKHYAKQVYDSAHLNQAGLTFTVFEKALTGYYNLKKIGKVSENSLLTIADFDQSSRKKRLYIIDLKKEHVLLNTWVAHGQRSGEDTAVKFSNQNDSFSSSIGFYLTAEEYKGAHGRSLRLDGMDYGYNDNARLRSIVIHGASYVSEGTIEALGRLGRSQGCPAVAPELSELVINTLGSGSVLYINKTDEEYHSKYLDEKVAAVYASLPSNPQAGFSENNYQHQFD